MCNTLRRCTIIAHSRQTLASMRNERGCRDVCRRALARSQSWRMTQRRRARNSSAASSTWLELIAPADGEQQKLPWRRRQRCPRSSGISGSGAALQRDCLRVRECRVRHRCTLSARSLPLSPPTEVVHCHDQAVLTDNKDVMTHYQPSTAQNAEYMLYLARSLESKVMSASSAEWFTLGGVTSSRFGEKARDSRSGR